MSNTNVYSVAGKQAQHRSENETRGSGWVFLFEHYRRWIAWLASAPLVEVSSLEGRGIRRQTQPKAEGVAARRDTNVLKQSAKSSTVSVLDA